MRRYGIREGDEEVWDKGRGMRRYGIREGG
jgi:hypothetical protein